MRLTNTFFYALLPAAAHTAVDYRLRKPRKNPAQFGSRIAVSCSDKHHMILYCPLHIVVSTFFT